MPETSRGLVRIWFGFPPRSYDCTFSEDQYISGISPRYYELGGPISGYSKADFLYYDVKSTQLCEIGWYTKFQGQSFQIAEKHGVIERGELIFTYRLGRPGLGWEKKQYNLKISGMTLLGEVVETTKDVVKIKLDIDEGWDPGGPYAYDWRPETGNMMYCMPQVGTRISLYFPNYDEKAAIAVNCVRTNGGSCARMSNPAKRSFVSEHGKELNLYPDQMGLVGGAKGNILLEDQTGISLTTEKKIQISGKSVTFQAPKVNANALVNELLLQKAHPVLGQVLSNVTMSYQFDLKTMQQSVAMGSNEQSFPACKDAPEVIQTSQEEQEEGFWDKLCDGASDTWDTITDFASDTWDTVTDFASAAWDTVTDIASYIGDFILDMGDVLAGFLGAVGGGLITFASVVAIPAVVAFLTGASITPILTAGGVIGCLAAGVTALDVIYDKVTGVEKDMRTSYLQALNKSVYVGGIINFGYGLFNLGVCFGGLLSGIGGFGGGGAFAFAGGGSVSTGAGAKAVGGIEGLIGTNSLALSLPALILPDKDFGSFDSNRNNFESNDSKTLDDILQDAEPGRDTKGKTTQYVKSGSYEQAANDFDALNPSDVKEITTKFGPGKTGKLSDGRTITARPGSSDGRPTLEIRNSNGRGIEVRYGK